MSSRTHGGERPSPQPSGSGERTTPSRQKSKPSNLKKQLNSKEKQSSKPAPTLAPSQTQRSRSAPVDDQAIRWAKQQHRYQRFLAEAEQRRVNRKQSETRNKMWVEQRRVTQNRLQAIEQEREAVLKNLHTIDAAMANYNASNGVAVSEEMDQETQAKWIAYFNMETDEFDV